MALEHVVNTRDVRDRIHGIPKHYKIDLAFPDRRIAVEIDGRSHRTSLGRQRDERKDNALAEMGWKVVRFTNDQVMADPTAIAAILVNL